MNTEMNKFKWVFVTVLFCFIAVTTLAKKPVRQASVSAQVLRRDMQDRRNIIIFMADDMGYEDAGFTGSKDILTPNLDRIAKSGVTFKQGYVCHPFCGPSRAALLSGRYQHRFGFETNPAYDPANPTVGIDPGEAIFWRSNLKWSVLAADGTKHLMFGEKPQLYHLPDDISESNNIISKQPERAQELHAKWSEWNKGNVPCRVTGYKNYHIRRDKFFIDVIPAEAKKAGYEPEFRRSFK